MTGGGKSKAVKEVKRFLDQFERFVGDSGLPGWVEPIRSRALARFSEIGFPSPKEEEWRQTKMTDLLESPFDPSDGADAGEAARLAKDYSFGGETAAELVFLNGRYSKELSRTGSLPEGGGVVAESLAAAAADRKELVEEHLGRYADYETRGFAALNTAFLGEGVFVRIPDGVVLEKPVHILYLSTGEERPFVTHPRNLVVVGKNAEAVLVESYAGAPGTVYFTNAVTEIAAGENSSLRHYRLQAESEKAYHVAGLHVRQEDASDLRSLSIIFGGALARSDSGILLDGEGIECTVDGLYVARGAQRHDNQTVIDHARPRSASHELFKGVLMDRAKGVFRGKIHVRRDAQKTDAKQSNAALLLSGDATVHAKPQLEIDADDVKCTHGATVGQLDKEALFYLQARGIDPETARSMLIYAFAGELVDKITFKPLRESVGRMLKDRMPQGGETGGER